MDLDVFWCLESSVFRGCASVPFEEVSQPAWLICSAASEGKKSKKKAEGWGAFTGERVGGLKKFFHWGSCPWLVLLTGARVNCDLTRPGQIRMQMAQSAAETGQRQKILQQSAATCCTAHWKRQRTRTRTEDTFKAPLPALQQSARYICI